MAITIDQFLRDLTERNALSGDESHLIRDCLAENVRRHVRDEVFPSLLPESRTATTTLPKSPLILCGCLILERLLDAGDQLIFSARRLRDDQALIVQVVAIQNQPLGEEFASPPVRGSARAHPAEAESAPWGLVEVDRHGELLCLCSRVLEAESLAQIVEQHGPLPGELAAECLLQAASILSRLERQGVSLGAFGPEDLLLDHDGQVSLQGRRLSFQWTELGCRQDGPPPRRAALSALGGTYHFLRTGKALAPPDLPSAVNTRLIASRNGTDHPEDSLPGADASERVFKRLVGSFPGAFYQTFEELISDLEALLAGKPLAEPPAPSAPPPIGASFPMPTRTPEPSPALADLSKEPLAVPSQEPEGSFSRNWKWLALVILVAGGLAFLALSQLQN